MVLVPVQGTGTAIVEYQYHEPLSPVQYRYVTQLVPVLVPGRYFGISANNNNKSPYPGNLKSYIIWMNSDIIYVSKSRGV